MMFNEREDMSRPCLRFAYGQEFAMKYAKHEAKAHARETMRGIWAAALNPFDDDLALDEEGLRRNIRHWLYELGIQGLFVAGKQGEYWSMSLQERKRNMTLAVEECAGKAGTIMSISDQNVDTVLELGQHAQECGADYVVVHAPMLSFCSYRDEVLYNYYKHLCDRLDIGIAMWSHPDSGYLMEPETCARIAELPNIMAIKYSVPREMYARLTRMIGDKILVSTSPRPNGSTISRNWAGSSISAPRRPTSFRPRTTCGCTNIPIRPSPGSSPRRGACATA